MAVLLSGVLIMVPFLGTQVGDIGTILLKSITNIQTQLQTIGLDQMIANAQRIPGAIRSSIVESLGNQSTID